MTQDQKTATLTTIFSEVLADLAFMFDEDADVGAAAASAWLETTISYHGPCQGTLRLRCSRDFCALLAANLLGVEPDDQDAGAQAEDAVKEFMNIVCGQLVTALHGAESAFNLTIPEIHRLPETPAWGNPGQGEVATLAVEGHRLQLEYSPG